MTLVANKLAPIALDDLEEACGGISNGALGIYLKQQPAAPLGGLQPFSPGLGQPLTPGFGYGGVTSPLLQPALYQPGYVQSAYNPVIAQQVIGQPYGQPFYGGPYAGPYAGPYGGPVIVPRYYDDRPTDTELIIGGVAGLLGSGILGSFF